MAIDRQKKDTEIYVRTTSEEKAAFERASEAQKAESFAVWVRKALRILAGLEPVPPFLLPQMPQMYMQPQPMFPQPYPPPQYQPPQPEPTATPPKRRTKATP
jgi:hypothetical protein